VIESFFDVIQMREYSTVVTNADAREAFLQRLEQHAGIIRKIAFGYARNPSDRHELMQEIRLQLWRAYPRYAPDRPFSTWMYRIALNVAISFLRGARQPQRQAESLDGLGSELSDETSGSQENEERQMTLQRLIAALDPMNRALLLLYLDDRSYSEIAQILGLSQTNVATKLSRLKQLVRQGVTPFTGA